MFTVDCIISYKAKVYSEKRDPTTNELISDWKEIVEQKFSHHEDVMALGVPLDVAHYSLLSESSSNWKSSMLSEDHNAGWLDYFKSFIVTSSKQESLDIPTLPIDHWKACFDRHCRKQIEQTLEIEPITLLLKKKGYSSFKDLSITIVDTSNFSKSLYYIPLYLCLYQFNNQIYTIMINGRDGTINGERPYNTMGYLLQAGVYGLQSLGILSAKNKT